MSPDRKIEQLRKLLKKNKLSAWIINGTDSHDSEYCSEHWNERKFISGFTGSAGIIVITADKALIWVDSRYFIQCSSQIEGTCFEMRKINGVGASDYSDFLAKTFRNSERIGIASETLMLSDYRNLKRKGLNIVPYKDLVGEIWDDRPELAKTPVRIVKTRTAGESVKSKLNRIRKELQKVNAGYTLISSLDDIAWILNLRADDIAYTPVFYSYLLISSDEAFLFTYKNRFSTLKKKSSDFNLKDYDDIHNELSKIHGRIVINPERINMKLFKALKNAEIVEHVEYSTFFKAEKNKKECEGFRLAHEKDAIALIKLIRYIKRHRGNLSELSVASKLEEFKKEDSSYQGPSFKTISAFAEHGAVVHYSADEKTNREIDSDGLLVLDCGSQYPFGTTDITRTFLFGKATGQQKQDYTAVLKGHIALSRAVFPEGTTGSQLDVLAHGEVWKTGANYLHGTGHGVGCNLSDHEGPQRISSVANSIALKEGMVISNEPGIYREGSHGIRIENLMLVKRKNTAESDRFFCFETLTLCPYEKRLIDRTMLTDDEIKYINAYHRYIRKRFCKNLNFSERLFLKSITRRL